MKNARIRFVLLICLATLSACRRPAVSLVPLPKPAAPPATPISHYPFFAPVAARPLIWRYRVNSGDPPTTQPVEYRSLETAVFDDGMIIWSVGQPKGGQPYRSARLTPEALKSLRESLSADASALSAEDVHASLGPDSSYVVIAYNLGPERQLELASWHELFESNPKLAVTDRGVEALEGRNKSAVLAAASPAYQRFRARWRQLTLTLQQAMPTVGEQIDPAQLVWK